MSRLKRATRATIFAQAFNWAGLLLSLFTIPLYLEWLGQERYGVFLTGVAFGSYLMFTDVGLTWGSMLLIAQANGRDDRSEIQSIVRTSFSLASLSAGVVVATTVSCYWLLTSSDLLSRWFPLHPESPGLLLAVGASVVCNQLIAPVYNVFNGLQETHLSAIYQGSARILGSLSALAVANVGAALGWVLAANVLAATVLGALATLHCCHRHPWAFRRGPFWVSADVRRHLRTGGKTFGMQVGNVMWVTAPVVSISTFAGAHLVPFFSVPMSLLNAPLGALNSLNASMQAGYGEAMGRGEREWIARTVQRILQQVLALLGLLGCGFLLLANNFVRLWTSGKIELEDRMLVAVLAIGCTSALTGVFRFTLTGINQHRRAAMSELMCGVLALLLGSLFVWRFGYQSIGLAVILATGLTSGWMLPRELRRALGKSNGFWPDEGFITRLAMTVCCTSLAGWAALAGSATLPPLVGILLVGLTCLAVFLVLSGFLLQPQVVALRQVIRFATGR